MRSLSLCLFALAVATTGCAPATPPVPNMSAPGAADGFRIVDCLLPGQVRRFGRNMTFLTARRAAKSTARDCERGGGEYVAYDRADYKTALNVWMESAQQGDPKAQTYVGEIYEKGLGVLPDHAAAALWYRRAAEQGYAAAALNLGVLYENGLGVAKDPEEAARWYRKTSGTAPLIFDVARTTRPPDTSQLEAQLDTLRRELHDKQGDLDTARRRLQDVRRELDQGQAEARTARLELERLRQEQSELQGKDRSGAARLTALQQAIAESEARVGSKEREVTALQARLGRVQEDALRQQDAKDQELRTLRDRLARAEGEIQAQRAGLENLTRERDQAGPEIELTQIQLVEPQVIPQTRDIRVQATKGAARQRSLLLAGRVRATVAIKSLSINGRDEVLDRDGLFKTQIPILGTTEERVRLVALDRAERKATLDMLVPGRVQPGAAPRASVDSESQARALPRPALGNYHALVIGNNKYTTFAPLKTAGRDADAVARVLRDRYGFTVRLLHDATRLQILSALNELRETLTEKDNLLIYYAGHGEVDQKNQRGYWLPVDAESGNTANWISNIDISDVFNLMAVTHLLVVADSCYAATLTRSAAGRLEPTMTEEELNRAMQTLAKKRARLVMTSGGIEPVLDGTGGPHSVFAQVFIEILESNSTVLLGRDLFRQLQLRVHALAQRAAGAQVPEYAPIKYAGHEGGDFFFLRATP